MERFVLKLRGRRYDVTEYLDRHPGGRSVLAQACRSGEDAWETFAAAHGNAEQILKSIAEPFAVSPVSMQEELKQQDCHENEPKVKAYISKLPESELEQFANVLEIEHFAKARLPWSAVTYIDYGAEDEESIQANRVAWKQYPLIPRVLRDVSSPSLRCTLHFSSLSSHLDLSSPIFIAPFAGASLVESDGELAIAKAAQASGTLYAVPHYASVSLEQLCCLNNQLFFQLYAPASSTSGSMDRDYMERVIDYVASKADGIHGVILTVDSPQFGNREKTYRSRKWIQAIRQDFGGMPSPRALKDVQGIGPHPGNSQKLTWEDVHWLRQYCNERGLALLVKGVMSPADAKLALQSNVQGIVVSNHGGRQLDGTIATVDAAAQCASVLRGTGCLCFVDGGIRRGKDVFRALALGCSGVFIGRPVLWSLAVGGEAGVRKALQLLESELQTVMQLAGCRTLGDIQRSHVAKI